MKVILKVLSIVLNGDLIRTRTKMRAADPSLLLLTSLCNNEKRPGVFGRFKVGVCDRSCSIALHTLEIDGGKAEC